MGSKRVPGKNIKDLGKKPLIAWTLDKLLESGVFAEVAVSTESPEIASVVRALYPSSAVRIVDRPARLAGDDSCMRDVVSHYLEQSPDMDWVGTFLPTYPFRRLENILRAHQAICSGHVLRVSAVTGHEVSSRDFYYGVEAGVRHFFREPAVFARLGSSCHEYHHRGVDRQTWHKRLGVTGNERNLRLHVDEKENLDIDTPQDFALAGKLVGKRAVLARVERHEIDGWGVVVPAGVDPAGLLELAGPDRLALDMEIPVLEPLQHPVFMFRFRDCGPDMYLAGKEAEQTMRPPARVIETQSLRYMPPAFVQNRFYRLIPPGAREGFLAPVGARARESLAELPLEPAEPPIPMERVIPMSEVRARDWYQDPVRAVGEER
jgi:CMP-N-acetylneuraminic acid synthetase